MKKTPAALALAALFLLTACTSSHQDIYAKLKKEPKDARHETETDTVRYTTSDMTVEATYLSPGRLAMYFSAFKGGVFNNPFPPRSYIVFSLTMENRGNARMSFNPKTAFLLTDSPDPIAAKDYTSIYTDFEFARVEDAQERMEAVKASCFDTMVIVEPGGRVQGLLVFPRRGDVGDSAHLLVDSIFMGYESRSALLSFKRGLGDVSTE